MEIEDRIFQFRRKLLKISPFYGDIVMHLEFVPDSSHVIAATDGKKVYYNPNNLGVMPDDEMRYILMHEVFHILLLHCIRDKNKDHNIWNIAGDLVVNHMLDSQVRSFSKAGLAIKRPVGALTANISDGDTVEQLYAVIKKDNEKGLRKGKTAVLRNSYWGNSDAEKHTVDIPDVLSRDIQATKLTSEEAASMENAVKELIQNAVSTEKTAGVGSISIPGTFLSLTESRKVNWRLLLKDMMDEVPSDESSYATPERKYIHMDLILPGHEPAEDGVEELWAFVDSSGSVSGAELNAFFTQLYRIVKEFACTVNIAFWSTSVGEPYRNVVGEKNLLKCRPNITGGTDINCVYDWLRDNKVKPNILLILTDGYFGTLNQKNQKPRLRRNTILILSEDSASVTDEMKSIGKVAKL